MIFGITASSLWGYGKIETHKQTLLVSYPLLKERHKLLNVLKEELRTTMTESKYKAYPRKDFALVVKESGTRYPDYCFKWYDDIDYTPERYLEELSFDRFLKIVEARWDSVTNG